MRIELNRNELSERIDLNRKRLTADPYYQISQVFAPADYDWYGDKEGRALLAFVSHYKISGAVIPCMHDLVAELPRHVNVKDYLGPVTTKVIHEQQLSGHSWLLRGLCEYHEQFGGTESLATIRAIVENLYLPTLGQYADYPVDRASESEGGVSGSSTGMTGAWHLSSDIGCAFMSIDGLSHAYKLTHNEQTRQLVDEMIATYAAIDKVKLRAQTHCTLTAARGMMRMFSITGEARYLKHAKAIWELYVHGGGMTWTYQNLNWWGRPDSWTEPCAVIDSLMLSLQLYAATRDESYRRMAARIWVNSFATLQRDNGGAGTDFLICPGSGHDTLRAKMYEAYFCCTMRLAEGLWFIRENADDLWSESGETIVRNEHGVYMCGDYIYAEITGGGEKYAEKAVLVDGHLLSPLVKYYRMSREELTNTCQKVVF